MINGAEVDKDTSGEAGGGQEETPPENASTTSASARRRQRRARVKMMGISDADAGLEDLDSNTSTATLILVKHDPLPLRARMLYEKPLTQEQKSNQVLYRNRFLKDIMDALSIIEERGTDSQSKVPTVFNEFMRDLLTLMLNLRVIHLLLKGRITHDIVKTFRDSAKEIFILLKKLQKEEAVNNLASFPELPEVKFSTENQREVTQLVSMISNLFSTQEDLRTWDSTIKGLPRVVMDIVPVPDFKAGLVETNKWISFKSGGVINPEGGATQLPASNNMGWASSARDANPKDLDTHMMPPPSLGSRPSKGPNTLQLEMPPGWYDEKKECEMKPGSGFMEFFKKNHASNYTVFTGEPDCTITLTDLWDKFKVNVHDIKEEQCPLQTKIHILVDHLLGGQAKALVQAWQGTAELGYPTAWNILLKRYGINRLKKEDYEDKIRTLIPKSNSFQHQLDYITQIDKYCGILVKCNVHQDDVASLAIPHIQRKIRRDVWSTVRIFLGINDTNVDTWFRDDAFTKFRILWVKILGNLQEISDHETFTDIDKCNMALEKNRTTKREDPQEDSQDQNSDEEEFSGYVQGGRFQKRGAQNYQDKRGSQGSRDRRDQQGFSGSKPFQKKKGCGVCGSHKHETLKCHVKDPYTRYLLMRDRETCVNCLEPDCPRGGCPKEMQCSTCPGNSAKKHSDFTCFADSVKANPRGEKSSQNFKRRNEASRDQARDEKPRKVPRFKLSNEGAHAALDDDSEEEQTECGQESKEATVESSFLGMQKPEEVYKELLQTREELQKLRKSRKEGSPS